MGEEPVSAERLIGWVDRRTRQCSELERVVLAAKVAGELSSVGDRVLDHYIEAARGSGASWSQIGQVLGVTKQAAQQRHVSRRGLFGRRRKRAGPTVGEAGPLERFSGAARRAVVLAQEEARGLGHEYTGTEHLLLGLCREEQGTAGRALRVLGAGAGPIREIVIARVGRGTGLAHGPMRLAPRTKRTFEIATKIADARSEERVETRDILRALFKVRDGMAWEILSEIEVESEELDRRLGAEPGDPA